MSVQTHILATPSVRFRREEHAFIVELAREADIRLGALLVRPSRRDVVVRGRRERLEPRVMQVLVALVRANGGVVSRDELIDSCWGGRIVGEDAIYRCIVRLRRIAEMLDGAFCIETIARVGYRLMRADVCANGGEPPPRGWPRRLVDAVARLGGRFQSLRP
jgi:DNA-binding winged helix-turn-helix (wHTH) protein